MLSIYETNQVEWLAVAMLGVEDLRLDQIRTGVARSAKRRLVLGTEALAS
jgi:hypothetical protein